MPAQTHCIAGSQCTQYETVAGADGKRRRRGKRMRGDPDEDTASGKVVCCGDCARVHAEKCEVRGNGVQARWPT